MNRDALIADWRDRLEKAEAEPVGQPRQLWLPRIRARLYRLLLSLYGDASWRVPAADPLLQMPSPVGEAISAGEPPGKPPKGPDQIRTVLASVAAAHSEQPAGPLQGGLPESSWVVVGAQCTHLNLRRCPRALREAGLTPRLVRRGGEQVLEVPAGQRGAAFEIVEACRREPPRRWRLGAWRSSGATVYDEVLLLISFAILMFALAVVVFVLLILGNWIDSGPPADASGWLPSAWDSAIATIGDLSWLPWVLVLMLAANLPLAVYCLLAWWRSAPERSRRDQER
jgi:hypothetical protein